MSDLDRETMEGARGAGCLIILGLFLRKWVYQSFQRSKDLSQGHGVVALRPDACHIRVETGLEPGWQLTRKLPPESAADIT